MSQLFITYAHESDSHRQRVIKLADRLKADRVDVMIDAYDPHPGEGWLKWMERQTRGADYILIIASPRYVSDFHQDTATPSGARYEAAIISAQIARSGINYRRFLVGIYDDCADVDLPDILYACPRYRLEELNSYRELVSHVGIPMEGQLRFASARAPVAELLTQPDRCLGRDEDIANLIDALLKPRATVLVLGGPGIGKTTLTRAVATSDTIISYFGNRRWFVPLETATDATALRTAISQELGLNPAEQAAFDQALERLRATPGLLILDNLETPWESDLLATQETLRRLASVPGLALLASLRGNHAPVSPVWTYITELAPLTDSASRSLFIGLAHRIERSDPQLEPFLRELGGVPLAIELVAQRAAPQDHLSELWGEWQRRGMELARHPDLPEDRSTSVLRSIDLSLHSSRLHHEGRRLFPLLAVSPAGMAPDDRSALLGGDAYEAARQLLAIGLAVSRDGRLDLLPPVRDAARRLQPISSEEAERWCLHYLEVGRLNGERIGFGEGAQARERAAPEWPNIEAALQAAPSLGLHAAAARATVSGVRKLLESTGVGSIHSIDILADACRVVGDVDSEAKCREALGDIARWHGDYAAARAALELALSLYYRIDDLRGAAKCIYTLGDISAEGHDYAHAETAYQEAISLFHRVGDIMSEANAVGSLGEIARLRSRYEEAERLYEQALPVFRQVNDVVGEAHCIFGLGAIAAERSQHNVAQTAFESALSLYRRGGDVRGEADCIRRLGEIALARLQHDAAREAHETALAMFRQVGFVLGVANCTRSLGDVSLECGMYDAANAAYQEALSHYRRIGSVRGEASCLRGLAEIALARGDHQAAIECFSRAAALCREVPDIRGEANCLRGLGDLARIAGNIDVARSHYDKALSLFTNITEPHGVGRVNHRLAQISSGSVRAAHVVAAREAWTSIQRHDLIAELNQLS